MRRKLKNLALWLTVILLFFNQAGADTNSTQANQMEYQNASVENGPHYISQNFKDTYEQKTNLELRDAIFDIVGMNEEDYSIDDLVYLASSRLANEDYNIRSEFRQLLIDSLKTIKPQAEDKFAFLGVSMIENCKSEIQSRYRDENAGNDQYLQAESDYLFSEYRNISIDQSIHQALRAKAVRYLGKNYTAENSNVVIQSLSDSNTEIVKNAGRALSTYFNFISEEEKENYIPDLIQTINDHKSGDMSELLDIKPVVNALGMINKPDAQSYLADLLEDTTNPDVGKQVLFALSYKATKDRVRFIIANLSAVKYDTTGSDKEEFFAGVVLENNSAFTELKNETDDDSQIKYLTGLRITRKDVDSAEKDRIIGLLNSSNADVRMQAVKTLHYILPFNEQQQVFTDHKQTETDEVIKWEIEKYIGL